MEQCFNFLSILSSSGGCYPSCLSAGFSGDWEGGNMARRFLDGLAFLFVCAALLFWWSIAVIYTLLYRLWSGLTLALTGKKAGSISGWGTTSWLE